MSGEPPSLDPPEEPVSPAPGPEEAQADLDLGDLAIVLSHYDMGVIRSITPIDRGAGGTAKFLVDCEGGRFVLKRRVERREEMSRVAFTHAVHIELINKGFPAPTLIGTKRSRSSIVVHAGRLYELIQYVRGSRCDHSEQQTREAGATLARLHEALVDFVSPTPPPFGTFHDAQRVVGQLEAIGRAEGPALTQLLDRYTEAAGRAEDCGVKAWPEQVIHGDWHPGNLLFSGTAVAAVLDYDTARMAARAIDLANGALQFSITRESGETRTWPDHLDEDRLRAFLTGYDEGSNHPVSRAELQALPWLMIEAMVAEAAGPVATTGRFAAIEGGAFLRMVGRKVAWLREHADRLANLMN
ncbi:MAG: phosphotransferase [Planctomycetota bacterium]